MELLGGGDMTHGIISTKSKYFKKHTATLSYKPTTKKDLRFKTIHYEFSAIVYSQARIFKKIDRILKNTY